MFFKPLTKAQIGNVVSLLLKDLLKRLEEKQLSLTLTQSAKAYIVEQGYDPVYGARPLKRYMQRGLETMIAKGLLSGDYVAGDTLVVDANENGLYLKKS